MRMGLEYGIIDNFNIGIGRSTVGKTLDGYVKYRFLRQSDSFPVTASVFGSIVRKTVDEPGLKGINR